MSGWISERFLNNPSKIYIASHTPQVIKWVNKVRDDQNTVYPSLLNQKVFYILLGTQPQQFNQSTILIFLYAATAMYYNADSSYSFEPILIRALKARRAADSAFKEVIF